MERRTGEFLRDQDETNEVAIRLKKWDLIFNFGTFSKYDHISLESKLLTLSGLKSIFRLLYRRVSSVVVVSRIYNGSL